MCKLKVIRITLNYSDFKYKAEFTNDLTHSCCFFYLAHIVCNSDTSCQQATEKLVGNGRHSAPLQSESGNDHVTMLWAYACACAMCMHASVSVKPGLWTGPWNKNLDWILD